MRLIFVSNHWEDPHQQARLRNFEQWGLKPVTFAFTRQGLPNCARSEPDWKCRVTNGRYFRRSFAYLHFCQSFVRVLRPGDLVYVWGLDLLLLVFLSKLIRRLSPKVIYELPDIRELLFQKNWRGWIARLLEAWVIPRVHLLVVTSDHYITNYLVGMRHLIIRNYLLFENKLEPGPIQIETARESSKIRIGYFGSLRCSYTLECLLQLAATGRFIVHMHGIFTASTQHLVERIQKQNNMKYHGPYRYPHDLAAIYANIDILWAGYPVSENQSGNHLWARTNRFYEGLYFRKPMILVAGTADACRARSLGSIAIPITPVSPSHTATYLNHFLNRPHIALMQDEIAGIHPSEYTLSTEYEQLQKWIIHG